MYFKINHTGREKIISHSVDRHFYAYVIRPHNSPALLNIDLSMDDFISKYPEFNLYLEYRYSTFYKFYDFGKLSEAKNLTDYKLDDIDPRLITITLKIVDFSTSQIKAKSSNIKPFFEDEKNPSTNSENLKGKVKKNQGPAFFEWVIADIDQVWQLKLQHNNRPQILLNRKANIKEKISASAEFKALLFPSFLRELLIMWFVDTTAYDCEKRRLTLKEIEKKIQCPINIEEHNDGYNHEIGNWIEEVVSAFTNEHRLLEELINYDNS